MTIQQLHARAIELADIAFIKKFSGDNEGCLPFFKQALYYEKQAAIEARNENIGEPSVSVLFKSAASLAINCNELKEAEQLIYQALEVATNFEIIDELKRLLSEFNPDDRSNFFNQSFSRTTQSRERGMSGKHSPEKNPIDRYSEMAINLDNTYGSELWKFNHFRTSILTSLLNDLVDLEEKGIDNTVCDTVQRCLTYFINATTNVPKGSFLSSKPLYSELEDFLDIYREWNEINGSNLESIRMRRQKLRALRKGRQKISNKVRKLQFELSDNIDQKILLNSYSTIGDLINLTPGMFKNLTSSYIDFTKKAMLP